MREYGYVSVQGAYNGVVAVRIAAVCYLQELGGQPDIYSPRTAIHLVGGTVLECEGNRQLVEFQLKSDT